MLLRRFENPATPGFIVMRRYKKLEDEHIAKYAKERPELQQYYNGQRRQYTLPNQSTLSFRAADTLQEIMEFARGPEVFDLFIDQAEQFTEDELKWLHTPNRWPSAGPGGAKTVLGFNPGGRGSAFQRRVFHERQFHAEERPTDYVFVTMYGWDNYEWFRNEPIGARLAKNEFYKLPEEERFAFFITETSEGRKLNSLPKHLRVGELLGSFDNFAGQYFAGAWDKEKCTLTQSQVEKLIKPWWTRWMAQDWAFAEHAAHGWFASGKVSPREWMDLFGGHTEHPMDVVIAYRELIAQEMPEADLANEIVRLTPPEERKRIRRFFLSQDAFGQKAKQQGAHSVGEQFARIMERYGLPSPEPADQERVTGWRFMYNCLRQANLKGENFDAERAKQGPAFFIGPECPNIQNEIPMAVRAEDDPDDVERVAGVLWEDVTDLCRYALKSMLDPRSKPREVRAQEVYEAYQDPTSKAMAMRIFDENEKRRGLISRRPRWRDSGQ